MAIKKPGSTKGDAVREPLHQIYEYPGQIKNNRKPFSAQNQDALGPDDYIFVRYDGTRIVPVH
jgi:branched-chain amino acid transport system substrate-binding protein